jgi:hypothetical protein
MRNNLPPPNPHAPDAHTQVIKHISSAPRAPSPYDHLTPWVSDELSGERMRLYQASRQQCAAFSTSSGNMYLQPGWRLSNRTHKAPAAGEERCVCSCEGRCCCCCCCSSSC